MEYKRFLQIKSNKKERWGKKNNIQLNKQLFLISKKSIKLYEIIISHFLFYFWCSIKIQTNL
jgi:hypothetical protein